MIDWNSCEKTYTARELATLDERLAGLMTEEERLALQRRQQQEELDRQARQRAEIQAEQDRQRQEKIRLETRVRQEEARLAQEREAIRRQQEENKKLAAQSNSICCTKCRHPLITIAGNNTTVAASLSFSGQHVVLGCSSCNTSNLFLPAQLNARTGGAISFGC